MDRAQIGATVRARLLATAHVMKVPTPKLDIFVVRDFLTPKTCAALIKRIDKGCAPSGILGPHPDPDFRTSQTCNLDPTDPPVVAAENQISALTGIDPTHGETLQGQRYDVGQQFKQHHDYFYTDQPYWPDQERSGGQRTWTVMAFLNAPQAGGHTFFEHAGVRIVPRAGNLLIWNNMDAYGEPNVYSFHQGLPVEAGVKHIVTKWYRERPWRPL